MRKSFTLLSAKKLFLCILSLLSPLMVSADDWDDFIEYLTTSETAEGGTLESVIETFEELRLNPIDINNCTHFDLERIPFLSSEQAVDIVYYVAQVRGMRTLNELLYIRSIDIQTRRFLPLFVCLGPYTKDSKEAQKLRLRDGSHDLLTTLGAPLYQRAGYVTDNDAARYQGSRLSHSLRYRYTLGRRVSVGLVADKDQGEPWGSPFSLGYDFVGGHAMLCDFGALQTLVVGDYHIGYGEGLLLNQHFALGKSVQNLTCQQGVAAKTSVGESDFMRGVAGSFALSRRWSVTAFGSYRLMDATVKSGTSLVSSLSTSTLHRNVQELRHRHNTSETLYGAHIGYRDSLWHIGLTAFGSHFHLPFTRGDEVYREYYPEGKTFWGASVDYGLRIRRWTASGETATDGHGVATLERVAYRRNARFSCEGALRYYAPSYHSFHSRALSEWGVQNEFGAYVSAAFSPLRRLHLQVSGDYYFSPHPRYRIDHSTSGQELRATADYKVSKKHTLRARGSWKRKEQYNVMHTMQRYQLTWVAQLSAFTLRTGGSLAHYSEARGRRSLGYDVQHTFSWHSANDRLRIALSGAWFSTDDYQSRLFITEPAVLGGTHTAMLYGEGVRGAATVRWSLARRFSLIVRYTVSRYFDRSTIGSDLQLINSPLQNDLTLQMRLRL